MTTPPAPGEFEGALTIQSNDPGRLEARIALSGRGVEAPPGPMINAGGVVNAASFAANAIAPGSILSLFGINLASVDAVATTTPLPTSLAGTSIEITDSAGVTRSASLFGIFNGGQQINFLIDPETAVGAAELTLRRSDGQASTVAIQVDQVGPGVFFIQNAAGQNVALANFLRISGGVATTELTFSAADFSLVRIDLGPEDDQLFVSLFVTGIQFASGVQNMSATIDGEPVPVFNFAGDLAQFVGLGQVNIGPIPRSFIGRGPVEISLTVDGAVANSVMVSFL